MQISRPAVPLTAVLTLSPLLCQAMLKDLRSELASSLADVESQLEQMGGSASTVSMSTAKSGMTGRSTKKSFATPSTVAEEEDC
jgi:hypothetical protein